MILQGHKKKVLKEVIRYYVNTTDKSYEDFILEIQKLRGDENNATSYSEWLSCMSFKLLTKHEISLADCIANKDTIRSAIKEDESRQGGEFYTPEVWAADGREYLKSMLGDLWGKAYIWDASAGTGNLLRTAGYPQDRLFLSTLLPEDVDLLKVGFPEATVFQLDFLDGIDWDDTNKFFSSNLPDKLIQVLQNDEPLVFYMNPPYKVMESNSSDVGAYMGSLGMAKCALDIFHQFMYRIVMIKRFYNLNNLYLGIFGPVTMFHSKMIEPLYNEFKKDFKFVDGMCFAAGDFANTSESVGWMVGYTTWRVKKEGEEDKSIILDAKSADADNNISIIGKRLVTAIEENLHEWVKPKDVVRSDIMLPSFTTFMNPTGNMMKTPENALGYLMSSNFVIRATRRACVTSMPNPDDIPITPESFWRAVASFVARRCYASKANPYNNSQYYSKPDHTVDGFNQWVLDALPIFLFEYSSHQAAYRNLEIDGQIWNTPNKMFPIHINTVKELVTDPVILQDIENNPPQNDFILGVLAQSIPLFGEEAREFFEFCMGLLLESLQGTKRADHGYENWTQAWDAGFCQIKNIRGFLTPEEDEKYVYLLSKLRHKLYDGIYKYGFMMDTAFVVEDEDTLLEEDEADLEGTNYV